MTTSGLPDFHIVHATDHIALLAENPAEPVSFSLLTSMCQSFTAILRLMIDKLAREKKAAEIALKQATNKEDIVQKRNKLKSISTQLMWLRSEEKRRMPRRRFKETGTFYS